MKKHILQIDSIRKAFGEIPILTDIHLKCESGEVVGLLGRNGCGKSTLLNIIFGTARATDRSVQIDRKVYSAPYREKTLMAMLPQKNFLPEDLKIKSVINTFLHDDERRNKVFSDDRLKSHLDQPIAALSTGQRRYLEVLLLLNLPVKFVLLDEPFSAIEPLYKERIKELINEYRPWKGFIITDHDYRNVIEVSDRIVLLANGSTLDIQMLEDLETHNYLPKGTLAGKDQDKKEEAFEPFAMDGQSLKDLDLHFGSVFSQFDNTRTKGGKAYLEKIFHSPTRNQQQLESRRDAIHFFAQHKGHFVIDKKQVDFVEYYLTSLIDFPPANYLESFFYYLRYRYSNDYYLIKNGIQNIVALLDDLSALIPHFRNEQTPPGLSATLFRAEEIINNPAMRQIRHHLRKPNALMFHLGAFDAALRKTLKNEMLEFLNIVYELEAYYSIAIAVDEKGYCFPEYADAAEPGIEIQGLFHPLIREPVANDVMISHSNNLCFLTGANMSGKSTFLKSFGIAMYLAHLGLPVPAKGMKTTIFNGMITTINLSDSLELSYSHFYHEVQRVRQAALDIKQHQKMIVIFDELFRGTNVKDASDASRMIIAAFAGVRSSVFFISTHIIEIAAALKNHTNISFACFETVINNDEQAIYTYKLKEGLSSDSYGLRIVKEAGITEILSGF